MKAASLLERLFFCVFFHFDVHIWHNKAYKEGLRLGFHSTRKDIQRIVRVSS